MKHRRKSNKVKSSQNQRNNPRLEEATRHLAQLALENDCPLLFRRKDVLGLIFSQLPTQKDALSFSRAKRNLRRIYSEWLDRRSGLVEDDQRMKAFATQQKEINYLLFNKDYILSENNADPLLISCLDRLAKSKDAKLIERTVSATAEKYLDMTPFHLREMILNELNERIIRRRIHLDWDELHCEICYLTRFPGSLINDPTLREYWSKLRIIVLTHNQLTTLPREIAQLKALRWLCLGSNKLTALPPEVGRLVALKALELELNQFTVLPPEIGSLVALRILNISYNQLTTLPQEIIGQLGILENLVLSGNQLSALPPTIGQLGSLQTLYVTRNQLTAVPQEIGQLRELGVLDVTHNQLDQLPDNIKEEILYASGHQATKAEILATQKPRQVEQAASPKRSRLMQQ